MGDYRAAQLAAKMLEAVIDYFDARMNDERHGQVRWVMPDGEKVVVDVGCVMEWWEYAGRKELLDVVERLRNNET